MTLTGLGNHYNGGIRCDAGRVVQALTACIGVCSLTDGGPLALLHCMSTRAEISIPPLQRTPSRILSPALLSPSVLPGRRQAPASHLHSL